MATGVGMGVKKEKLQSSFDRLCEGLALREGQGEGEDTEMQDSG